MNTRKKPLYRSIGRNKSSLYYSKPRLKQKYNRNTKQGIPKTMSSYRGNDLTGYSFAPLYNFLNSKAGCKWDDVYSEACKRLKIYMREAIFHIVDLSFDENRAYPSTMQNYKQMFVDKNGILQTYLGHPLFKGFNTFKEYIKSENDAYIIKKTKQAIKYV